MVGESKLEPRNGLVYLELAVYAAFTGFDWGLAAKLWLALHAGCSLFFLCGTLFAGSHHHDDAWHQGDKMKDTDYGINQIDAIKDRVFFQSFLMRTYFFGEHHLHHMFPTVDHYYLPLLQPAFKQTCKEFGFVFVNMCFFFSSLLCVCKCWIVVLVAVSCSVILVFGCRH